MNAAATPASATPTRRNLVFPPGVAEGRRRREEPIRRWRWNHGSGTGPNGLGWLCCCDGGGGGWWVGEL